MQARMLVAFIMKSCCWLTVKFVFTRTPTPDTRSFFAKLLSSWSAPVGTGDWGIPPQVQNLIFSLAELHRFPSAHFVTLLRFL